MEVKQQIIHEILCKIKRSKLYLKRRDYIINFMLTVGGDTVAEMYFEYIDTL